MRKIFMLLVACVAMVFVSCSKDDEDDGQRGTNGEKLVSKLNHIYSDGVIYISTYEYDSKGRVTNWTEYYDGTVDNITTYSYGDKEIKVIGKDIDLGYDDYISTTTYALNANNLIISSLYTSNQDKYEDRYIYSYNNENQLVKVSGENENFKITWKDGNIVKEEFSDKTQTHTYTYSYSNNENKTMMLNVMYDLSTLCDPLFCYGYFGSINKNLVSGSNGKDKESSYEYELDKDGYVTVMKEYKTENGQKVLDGTITVEYK